MNKYNEKNGFHAASFLPSFLPSSSRSSSISIPSARAEVPIDGYSSVFDLS
jgi:hypothetical protein